VTRLPVVTKEKAIRLRIRGFSVKEIAQKMHIAQGTSSIWLRNIKLSEKAQNRLKKRKLLGYYKASLWWQQKRAEETALYEIGSIKLIKNIKRNSDYAKIYCALLFWCEGGKEDKAGVRFVNSDPLLIETFIKLFRKAFPVREEKFRVLMHLHEYHDDNQQKEYWSKVTGVPKNQFSKTYLKPHTKKRLKDNYPGCICISYHDVKLARELKATYGSFARFI